uniref:Uncharacterized protein n=1 Tax=Parascaris univalens TaxID=6257 RepID=A0A915B3S9_PARUN
MFMVSTTNAVPIYTSYTAIAPSSSSCDIGRMFSDMNIGEDLAASSESDKSFGGLSRSIRMKRSVSSLKGSNGQGCDIDLKTRCIVEARQIEIDFSSITSKSFMVRISAPNNEMSNLLVFSTYGTTGYFCPKMDGCGHGMWTFEVLQQDGSRLALFFRRTFMTLLCAEMHLEVVSSHGFG